MQDKTRLDDRIVSSTKPSKNDKEQEQEQGMINDKKDQRNAPKYLLPKDDR